MLEIRNLKAYYGQFMSLKGVSLKVKAGTIVTIIGANGAGKSTLLKSISGLIRSKEGAIIFEGMDISKYSSTQIVRNGLSQVPEGRQIFSHLTVEDNLDLGAYHYAKRSTHQEIKAKKDEMFQIFPVLLDRRKQLSGTLSGGEQQMLAIARALMAKPKLLVLDEPSMGLAPLIVKEIFRILAELNAHGTTILLVEQNARAALAMAQYGYVLETGQIALEGPSHELLHNEKIKSAYLGG